jgi:hypothetical protein
VKNRYKKRYKYLLKRQRATCDQTAQPMVTHRTSFVIVRGPQTNTPFTPMSSPHHCRCVSIDIAQLLAPIGRIDGGNKL